MSEYTTEERVALDIARDGIRYTDITPETLTILETSDDEKLRCIANTIIDLDTAIMGAHQILTNPEHYTLEEIQRFADRLDNAFVELEGGETSHEQTGK